MPGITLANDEPRKVNPRSVLICEVMVIIAAAEQKAEITGPDMKSIIHPKENKFKLIQILISVVVITPH